MLIQEILKFNIDTIKQHIQDHHNIYDFPIKDIAAENILANFFDANGCKTGWKPGSHKPGSDVFIYAEGLFAKEPLDIFGYSVKSGKEPLRGEWFKISSYRTGANDSLEDKRKSIRVIEEEITSYVVFARTESKVRNEPVININYSVYFIEPEVLAIDTFQIPEAADDKGNFNGANNLNVKIVIAKNMSSQVWYSVPMTLVRENKLVKRLCEIGPFAMKLRPMLEVA